MKLHPNPKSSEILCAANGKTVINILKWVFITRPDIKNTVGQKSI